MKKKFFIFLITILLSGLSMLVGCSITSSIRVDRIYILEGDSFEIAVGDFDCMDYTVVAVSNGIEYYYPLTLDMLSAEDVFSLYKSGTYTLTVNAFDHTCKMEVEVLDNSFADIRLVGVETEYTGEEFHAELVGALPQGTQVIYPDGNSFTEVGTYNVSAVLICPNYNTCTLYADVIIKRAKYDMSGITFESKTFVYDGTDKSISIEGTLPEGVTVSYRIGGQNTNTQRLADENGYRVEAVFKSANVNYEEISSMFAILTIKKADYDMSALQFEDREEFYSGEAYDVYFDKEDKLPKGCVFGDVTARYTGLDGEEHVIASTNKLVSSAVTKIVQLVNAYDYTIEYTFNVGDGFNYNVPEPITQNFSIKKIEYKYYNLDFLSDSFEYDGTSKMLEVTGDFGDELHITYEGNGMVDVGKYDVTANFTVYDGVNYIAPESMHATLIILQANFDLTSDYFTYSENVQYTGEPVLPEINSNLPDGLEFRTRAYKVTEGTDGEIFEEEVETPIEIGSYTFKISVVGEALKNYHKINTLVLPYNIIRRTFDFSDLSFVNEFDYDGSLHTPQVLNLPEGLSISFDKQAKDVKDGTVETTATFAFAKSDEHTEEYFDEHYILPFPIKTYVKINPIRYTNYYTFTMEDKHETYNNVTYSIVGTISGDYKSKNDLKNNVDITYTLQKKGLDRVLAGNGTSEAGEYIITAHIELTKDKNYYFDEYTATLIIDHGNVRTSVIEDAIEIRAENGKSYVVLNREKLGGYDYVYDDFEGYYELTSDGVPGLTEPESRRYYFGTHDIYLKFKDSPLYSIVDDKENTVHNFTPCKRMELATEVDFGDYYSPELSSDGWTLYNCAGKEILYFSCNAAKANFPEVKVYSATLTYKEDTHISQEAVVTPKENGSLYYDAYYFYVPYGLAKYGEYTLTFDIDFVDPEFKGEISINNVPSYTYKVDRISTDEYIEVVNGYLGDREMFYVKTGGRGKHYASGYMSGYTDDFKVEGSETCTVSIDTDYLSDGGDYFASDRVDGVKFGYGKLYYIYKLSQSHTYGNVGTVSGNSFTASKEGYYRVYFVPDVYCSLTGGTDTSMFGTMSKWSDDEDEEDSKYWGEVPSIEIYVKTETHDYISDSDVDNILFITSYVGLNNYYDFATFKDRMNNNGKDNPYVVTSSLSPENINELSDYMLTDIFSQDIPDYITLEIKDIPSSYTIETTSRYSQPVNGSEDLWYFYEYRTYSFTFVVTLDKGKSTERQLYNSTIYMKDSYDFNVYSKRLSSYYHNKYGDHLPSGMIPDGV